MAFENSTKFKHIVKKAVEKHNLDPEVAEFIVKTYYGTLYSKIQNFDKVAMRMEYFGVLLLSKRKVKRAIERFHAKLELAENQTFKRSKREANFQKLQNLEKALEKIENYYETINSDYTARMERKRKDSGGN